MCAAAWLTLIVTWLPYVGVIHDVVVSAARDLWFEYWGRDSHQDTNDRNHDHEFDESQYAVCASSDVHVFPLPNPRRRFSPFYKDTETQK